MTYFVIWQHSCYVVDFFVLIVDTITFLEMTILAKRPEKPKKTDFGNGLATEEDFDHWEQNFMLRQDNDPGVKKWGSDKWFRLSCIPISVTLIFIILIALIPLLETTNTVAHIVLQQIHRDKCCDECSMQLVESIPEGMSFSPDSPLHVSTHSAWLNLIKNASESIAIASFYWSLRKDDLYPHKSSIEGEEVFQALYDAGVKKNIKIKIVQSAPKKNDNSTDIAFLVENNAAEVRTVNFTKLLGAGVLHTKLWLIDGKHFYIGSANMDWRSLTQVKEMGVIGNNCHCLVEDINKIFEVYWSLGTENAVIPSTWPPELQTSFNSNHPMSININGFNHTTFVSSSPPPLSPLGRNDDAKAIIDVMQSAEKFIYIAVMDYLPLMIYSPKIKFWPVIDDTIRKVALENKVQVRMLISLWNSSRPSEDYFLRSLTALTKSYPHVDIQVKRFIVPATEDQKKIPFARVNHNKYMVTDKTAYIGTSNWSGDYFVNTAGVALVVNEPDSEELSTNGTSNLRQQLQDVFERDWYSDYAKDLLKL